MHQIQLSNIVGNQDEADTQLIRQSDPRSEVISIDPERMWGTLCIAGTRVPIKSLFDHLSSGTSLHDFEGVSRENCVATLQLGFEHLMNGLPNGRPEK